MRTQTPTEVQMFNIMETDPLMLSTEALRAAFGAIRLEIMFQTAQGLRVSCVRRVEDGVMLACSVVHFKPAGAALLGTRHQKILDGAPLGQTIAASGMRSERIVSVVQNIPTSYATQFLFGVAATHLPSRTVEYHVGEQTYCRIRELYNPSMVTADGAQTDHVTDGAPFLVAPVRPEYREAYLRLAHRFLWRPMHVGIADEHTFVHATTPTFNRLMADPNTALIVAADHHQFIGYAAVNMHPALHVNGGECMLRELYVRDSARRRGVATALVTFVERLAVSRGCKRIALATNWEDDVQRSFYTSLRFAHRCDFVTNTL